MLLQKICTSWKRRNFTEFSILCQTLYAKLGYWKWPIGLKKSNSSFQHDKNRDLQYFWVFNGLWRVIFCLFRKSGRILFTNFKSYFQIIRLNATIVRCFINCNFHILVLLVFLFLVAIRALGGRLARLKNHICLLFGFLSDLAKKIKIHFWSS